MRTRTWVAGLLVASLIPWTVIVYPDDTSYVFAWGLANVDPVHVTTLTEYLFVRTSGLPRHLLAWPVSVLLYLLAVASAGVGALWKREDDRRESSERASGEERQRRAVGREGERSEPSERASGEERQRRTASRDDDLRESSERANGEERQRRTASREGLRVTAGLLAFAGASHATFAIGLQRPNALAIPVGTVLLWALAGYAYLRRRSLRR